MRLLFVAPYVPLATKPRPYRLIEHLSRSHEIHLVAFELAPDTEYAARPDFQPLQRHCASITLLPLPRLRRYANVLGSVVSKWPARAAYYGRSQPATFLAQQADRLRVDGIHVDRLRIAGLCNDIALPKVVDATDCISDYLFQCARYVAAPARPAYLYEAAKTKVFEQHAALATADTSRSFADSVIRLLTDADARLEIGRQARRYARWRFHPALVTAQLDNIFGGLVSRPTAGTALPVSGGIRRDGRRSDEGLST